MPEVEIESPETTEAILRNHLTDALKIAQKKVASIKSERVHRSLGENSLYNSKVCILQRQGVDASRVEAVNWNKLQCV
ncbi:hypothetical protein DPMN_072105 [Dreissena polymorpha]|uniref:Uncharacterized protein n=1 Tax=Dreissena polymorpha TaxID=45954 RepID=A0A9D3Z870_DREPO|nr:hypothetical protein DPMN_072105 [Dreissena polymorpha]